MEASPKLTPMMRQYYELKSQAKDAILFFRMGDFYEIFGEDASTVAPILQIVLTAREKGNQEKIPFCGVPHHAAQAYWVKLLKLGHKVAIADQTEDPSQAKGLVRREIIKVLTPACIDELEGLDSEESNYLATIFEHPETRVWALVLADISTGEMRTFASEHLEEVLGEAEKYRPKELLVRSFCRAIFEEKLANIAPLAGVLIGELSEEILRDQTLQTNIINEVFGGVNQSPAQLAAVAATLHHYKSLFFSLDSFHRVSSLHDAGAISLNEIAIRDLELFESSQKRTYDGSLLKEINYTLSPMGARFLRHSLVNLLCDAGEIAKRHRITKSLMSTGEKTLKECRDEIGRLPDFERLASRVFTGKVNPYELKKFAHCLEKMQWVHDSFACQDKLDAELKNLATSLGSAADVAAVLGAALTDHITGLGSGSGVFRSGFDKELDECLELSSNGSSRVDDYLSEVKKSSGISNLKIKRHKTFGLLIEVTKAHLNKLPENFKRRQTMVNCERFSTEQLLALDEKLQHAEEQAVNREMELYKKLVEELFAYRKQIIALNQAFAKFDFFLSLAWLATKHDYVQAELSSTRELKLLGARHPVVENFVGRGNFVPNDIHLAAGKHHALITGPNMAGKSTVMRQTAVCAILNQLGSFVPARQALLPIFDQVFTRVGASDNLARGQSTFMVEMSETAGILKTATANSLVILDEVGRGTSTEDGYALAKAIFEFLITKTKSVTLFATHYHELTALEQAHPGISLLQTEVSEVDNEIFFTHRLIEGACSSSFGIEVAKLAGLPVSVLDEAKANLYALKDLDTPSVGKGDSSLTMSAQMVRALEVLERIDRLKLERLTPLQVVNIIDDIKRPAASEQAPLFQ